MADTLSASIVKYLYYEDLHYIPESQKDELWAAQCLVFMQRNNSVVVTPEEAKKFRDIDRGIINAQDYKDIFDPKEADGEGGKAEHVAADWKANPIYIHLNNIAEANLEKIPVSIYCKATDEYAKSKQQKDNERIIARREFFNLINDLNKELGFPLLKEGEDPYRYAKQMQQRLESEEGQTKGLGEITDSPTGIVDMVKNAITDNEDMALYNELVYKGDVEIGIEIGIKHCLNQNKFERKAERIIADIRNFNRATARTYTNAMNGELMVEYLDPITVKVSSHAERDGSDISSWKTEYDVNFRDFVRMFGKNLNDDQLAKVFALNKTANAAHGFEWSTCNRHQRDNAKIRIGYAEVETQNCSVFAVGNMKGNFSMRPAEFDWQPSPNTIKKYKTTRTERHYNVWYKFYYVPLSFYDSTVMSSTDFQLQAQFVFELGKLQDQQRYGDDQRLSKSSLVMWSVDRMSYSQIMDRFMPKIHFLWQSFQNDLGNHMPHGLIFAEEMVQLMMSTSDDAGKTGKDGKLEFMRRLKQTGYGITKMQNSDGKLINDGKPFAEVKTGHLESAREKLLLIMDIYNMCKQSIGVSDIAEGLDPKPRQSLGGINLALDANNKNTWNMEKAYIDMCMELEIRILNYIIMIANEPESDRFKRFRAIVGAANGMAVEALKDIPNHELGLFIDNVNTEEQKAKLEAFAQELVKAQLLDIEVLNLIIKVDNYKYAAVLMILKYKQKRAQLLEEQALAHQRAMQLKDMDLQIQRQGYLDKAKAQTMIDEAKANLEFEKEKWLAQWKSHAQQLLKEITKNNKIEENITGAQIEKEQKMEEPAMA